MPPPEVPVQHVDLLLRLKKRIDSETFEDMKVVVRADEFGGFQVAELEKVNNVIEMLRKLEEKGVMGVGEYTKLKEIMKRIDQIPVIDDIVETEVLLHEQGYGIASNVSNAEMTSHRVSEPYLSQASCSGVMGETSVETALGETLVSHYKETMKVNTHPTYKDRAVDMDDLYVSLELLQETNQPDQPITLQSCFNKDEHRAARTVPSDIKGDYEVDKTHTVYKNIPLKSYKDMLSFDKKRILITAESGYGKSTLLKKIAYDWAVLHSDTHVTHQKQESPLSKYNLVFLLEINKMEVHFNIIDEIFSQILSQNEFGKKSLENYITRHPDKVLILLDGADEVSFEAVQKAKDDFSVNNVLSFKSLKRCKTIVTSRQSTALKLLTCNPDFTRVNIVGFDGNNKQEYIRKYFSNSGSQHHAHVFSEISKSETLRSLGEIPLFLWLMCSLLTEVGSRLPDRISELLRCAISIFYEQKMSKDCTSDPHERITEDRFNELVAKLGQAALEGLMLKSHEKHYFSVSEFDSEELVNFGCEVGLLTRVQFMHGIDRIKRVKFYHMIFMEFCCSVYLSDLAESSPDNFNTYLSKLLEGDVDRIGYLIRFCSWRNTTAAKCVIELTRKNLLVCNKNTPVECERYVCLHKIMMLALFEAKLDSTVETLALDEWVRFPFVLKGEDLLAAHFFFRNLQERSSLRYVSDITIQCQRKTDLDLLEQMMAGTKVDLSLEVVGVNMKEQIQTFQNVPELLTSLTLRDCKFVSKLVKLIPSATKLMRVDLSGNNLHGLKSDQIPRISSLKELYLRKCNLQCDDIGPLFSIVAAAGSVTRLVLHENDLHGINRDKITPVSTLNELRLIECNLQSDDVGQVFSIVAAAGSVTVLVLQENDFHGIKVDERTPVPSLKELHLVKCKLKSGDIGQLFSIVATAGSVTALYLIENDLHGIKGDEITQPVSSLKDLCLWKSSLQSDDIGPLFSIVAAAGSVRALDLKENDLHGIKGDEIIPVSSLNEVHLWKCNLRSDDVGSVFSIVATAGSVRKLALHENDLHGIKEDQITPVSSLTELFLWKCKLKSDDIGPLFSILASAESVTALELHENDLKGLKGDEITPVSSLNEVHLKKCYLQSGDIDIGQLFSFLAAAGSVTILALHENDLHGIKGDQKTPVPSLNELHLLKCKLRSDDVGSVFSIVAAAGSVTLLALHENDLHGIKRDDMSPFSSLKELHLRKCNLQSDDIGPLFSFVAAAGSVTTLVLEKNDLHGITGDEITRVSSLKVLCLLMCNLRSDDIWPLFSTVAAAGSIKKAWLNGNNLRGIQGDQLTPVSSLEFLCLTECGLQDDDLTALSLALDMKSSGTVLQSHRATITELAECYESFPG